MQENDLSMVTADIPGVILFPDQDIKIHINFNGFMNLSNIKSQDLILAFSLVFRSTCLLPQSGRSSRGHRGSGK